MLKKCIIRSEKNMRTTKKIENNNPVVESWLCPCPRRLLSWCCGYLAPIVPHTRALGEAGVLRLRACTAPEYKR
jgi:hypothetical protein